MPAPFACPLSALQLTASVEKTLVSWIALADRNVRAGSILTIQNGDQFDGIVYGERTPQRWMAGSNFYHRTENNQERNPAESAAPDALVQIAIVYRADRISIYRNGESYCSYAAKNIDLLGAKDNFAVFGLRHIGGNGSIAGAIEDARIYAQALTAEQIKALKPNQPSALEPWAWWDFEGDQPRERTGRFSFNNLESGATLKDGKLVLVKRAVFVSAHSERRAREPYVPFTPTHPDPFPETWLTYHLAHPGPDKAIPADPNCAIFHEGRYHLHYIFQNKGHSFAHVSSTDMVLWKWHPTSLTPPATGHGMFSGTAFKTLEGKPAIIYHGQGSGRNQIAIALDDRLEKWSDTIAVDPKTEDGKAPNMRHWDPDCWVRDGSYWALAGGGNPTISKSSDLQNWIFQGELFHPDFPKDLGVAKGEDVSCANLFPIGDKWMLLCISHGLGCRYYLGEFKDGQFLPQHHALLNWARWDFFAPESLLTPDGRRVMWAWCTPWVNGMQKVGRKTNFEALMKGRIQPGIQSLPRELSLSDDGALRIAPLRELQSLRTNPRQLQNITVKEGSPRLLADIAGDTIELALTISAPAATEFGLEVLCDENGEGGFPIASGKGRKDLTVGYVNPPFALAPNEDLSLRVFIDHSMIEVFANDRQAAVAWHEYDPKNRRIRLFSKGGEVTVTSLRAWDMNSIYEGQMLFKP